MACRLILAARFIPVQSIEKTANAGRNSPAPMTPRSPIRFSCFEVDLKVREIRKRGIKVRLQDQPFEVLAALLERPGQLVTREELQTRIWAGDTFVDFDRGLNKAINRIREALGDVAATPRFIETQSRRGYRFIAPINDGHATSPNISSAPRCSRPGTRPIFRITSLYRRMVLASPSSRPIRMRKTPYGCGTCLPQPHSGSRIRKAPGRRSGAPITGSSASSPASSSKRSTSPVAQCVLCARQE
jgi:DNA-binding winged helix-turn-helix (wHTH) protein